MNSHETPRPLGLVALSATAAIVGLATGLVSCGFRLALEWADVLRTAFIGWAHPQGFLGFVLVVATCTALVAIASYMVTRFEPAAEGSGIPRVEAVVKGEKSPSRMRLLPIKFVGGVIAIGAGLTLGREGPSVHMGGNVARIVSHYIKQNHDDLILLIASGAAAGLTSAFSAPLAGAVFVLEELVKKFDVRTTIAVLASSGMSYLIVHAFFGDALIFSLPDFAMPQMEHIPVVALVAAVCGLVAVFYNYAILRMLSFVEATGLHPTVIATAIGALIGVVAWCAPGVVGGGDSLTHGALLGQVGNEYFTAGAPLAPSQGITLTDPLMIVVLVFAVRFVLVVISYSARTPGGLFAPMLVLGSQLGLIIALIIGSLWPGQTIDPGACAVIGMAAFFAASVQAPVTGLVLGSEMTGAVALLPPMLGACAIALGVARACKSEPIYEALAKRSAAKDSSAKVSPERTVKS